MGSPLSFAISVCSAMHSTILRSVKKVVEKGGWGEKMSRCGGKFFRVIAKKERSLRHGLRGKCMVIKKIMHRLDKGEEIL